MQGEIKKQSRAGLPREGNSRLVAAEIFSAGVCNLNCSYCFIPKDEMMKEYHEGILKGLDDGDFLNVLKEMYDGNLEAMSFWGTEPTLSLEKIERNLPSFFEAFPSLRHISFSTNFIAFPGKIISFTKALDKIATKKIKFGFQISIDGPEWITDAGRGKGVTEKILINLEYLLIELKKLELEKVELSFYFKATVDMDSVRVMNKNPEMIENWFVFFAEIVEKIAKAKEEFKTPISIPGLAQPTLVVPGKYTSEDGRDLAEFYKLIEKLHLKFVEGDYSQILKQAVLNSYTSRLLNLFNNMETFLNKPENLTCSGFDTQAGVDLEGNLMPCHRFFLFKNEKYVSSLVNTLDDWSVSLFNETIVRNIQKFLMPNIHTSLEKDFAKYNYIGRTYHDHTDFRMSQVITLIKGLARKGQASETFLKDENLCWIFAAFVNTMMACPVENYLNSGSINMTPISILRVLGNGAFEQVLKEALEIKGVK